MTRFRNPTMPRPTRHGFTLIELLIVLAVAALLASLAYPTYLAQVAKGRRADGRQALLALAQRLERHGLERGTYAGASVGAAGIYPSVSAGGYYALAITQQGGDAFTITASPQGAQTGDACGTLAYNQDGETAVGAGATLGVAQCW